MIIFRAVLLTKEMEIRNCMELENVKVIDLDDEEIHRTGKFLITAETIGPYHLRTDWF